MPFELSSSYKPRGDQAQAIEQLTRSLLAGNRHQTLLGVTGSGKTFTIANVIQQIDRPTLVMSHNKTLAAQLYSEFKQFFPRNAVEYFVSYFDYYQPEAYIPRTDTYIEKDSSINEEIERLRLSAVSSLLSRRDTIVVASVSCIYGLASPEDFLQMLVTIKRGQMMTREAFLAKLVDMLYERNDIAFARGRFRVRGDVVEVHPAQADDEAIRVEFFGDEIDRISQFDPLTGHVKSTFSTLTIYPAKQFVTPYDKLQRATRSIREELDQRIVELERENKLVEAQRLRQRTEFDLEMMQEMGFCNGIENYSRHLSGRPPGSRPYTLMDFLPDDFLVVIDESHATVPQIGGMFAGDRSRKTVLVNYGFRLPSALDNRPLSFEEFMATTGQIVYVSATPGEFELRNSVVGNTGYIANPGEQFREQRTPALLAGATYGKAAKDFDPITPNALLVIEQIIRPTGLLDPKITVRPLKNQIDETIELCRRRIETGERVLVTTLTKRTAEDLADYLRDVGLEGSLSPQRHRYDRAGRDTSRFASRRVRCARGHQSASRGPGPARSEPRLYPRRGQGGLFAVADLAHTDRRQSRATRQRRGRALCGSGYQQHAKAPRRQRIPARPPARLQRGTRDHTQEREPCRAGEPPCDPQGQGSRARHPEGNAFGF